MKKFYLLSLLFCLSLTSFGQTTIYIYAQGAPGSYITGCSTNTTRTEGAMNAIPFSKRAYAEFDLASNLPAGAAISSVNLGFDVSGVSGTGSAGSTVRGFNGRLSTVTVPATLYTDMGNPTSTNIYATPWPTTPGNAVSPSTGGAVTFFQNALSGGSATGFASVVWAAGGGGPGGLVYDFTDETGSTTTTGTHAPYLEIVYDCPAMATTATAPTGTICANTTFSLTGSATGATSYLWSGPGGFTSTMASPSVAGGASSTGVYTLMASDGAGCSMSATATVIINPAPVTTITALTSTAFCAGDNASLGVPTAAGDIYQWYNGSTPISGATNASYTSTVSGTYKVMVTDGAGCSGTTVIAVPTVLFDGLVGISPANPVRLCSGDNGMMTINTNGVSSGIQFQWQLNGVDIPGATNGSYITTMSGVFDASISVPANGCTARTDTDTVIVNSYPTPVVSNVGGMVRTANTYALYQWFLNTVAIPGATNYSVAPPSNGSYRVRVTDINGCSAFSAPLAITTVGVGYVNKQEVSIYPNPASNMIHIESPETVRAVITGIEGRKLMEQTNVTEMDISKLVSGMYIVSLYNNEGERIAVQQFVKE